MEATRSAIGEIDAAMGAAERARNRAATDEREERGERERKEMEKGRGKEGRRERKNSAE